MVIIWEGTLNTITTVFSNNFEFPVSRPWFADAPEESYLVWRSYLAIGRRSFDGWNAPSESCLTRCSYFVIILNFCIDPPCGFQPIRIIIFHFSLHFILSLTFAWTALSGFQSIETLFFLPKPFFQVCDLSSFLF